MKTPALRVRFWGVRGSAPAPAVETLRYGGHTACLQIALSARRHVILDAGTGIRPLGEQLMAGAPGIPQEIFLFLTHYHFDHLQGLPLFPPLHQAGARIAIHGHRPPGEGLQRLLERFISPPLFPVALADRPSDRSYHEVPNAFVDASPDTLAASPASFDVDDLRIRAVPLHHPGGATGWKVERAGRSLLYATDFEPGHEDADALLLAAAEGVDLLVADAHFQPEEREKHPGWGHGSWRETAELAARAGAGRLVLFHHHPARTDRQVDAIVEAARKIFPATDAAREGMEIPL